MEKKVPNKGRPRTNKRSGKQKYEKEEAKGYQKQRTSSANDPQWYTVNGQLLKDVASFNFNRPAGERTVLTAPGSSYDTKLPGIMTIMTMPTVGISSSNIDPVNKAMQKIYSFVRHANSGHSNYDPVDLMLYLMAMDSIYTFWAYLTRVYGAAMVFSKDNMFVGDAVLNAMRVNPGDIRTNLAEFRAYINMFAVRASTWAVPNVMSYYVRHSWMYSNIYKDEDTARAQYYMYVPAGLYKFQLDDQGAGMLKFTPLGAVYSTSTHKFSPISVRTFKQLKAYGDALLTALEGVEDIGIMSGDILKAYGQENLWKLVQIPETYGVTAMFSDEVLAQIHNTQFAGVSPANYVSDSTFAYGIECLDVRQNTDVGGGNLVFHPYFADTHDLDYSRLLDLWYEEVTPEISMVATRNMVTGHAVGTIGTANITAYEIDACGSEIALFGELFMYDRDGMLDNVDCYTNTAWDVNTICSLSKFNEAPHCIVFNDAAAPIAYFGELNNFAMLSHDNIADLHTAALLSMFNIANVG